MRARVAVPVRLQVALLFGGLMWGFRAIPPACTPLSLSCPARGLEARLDRRGYELRSREWTWGLKPRAYGRAGDLVAFAPSTPVRAGARVVYPRQGIREWYEARPEGIEQGFDVLERPAGAGPLVVEQEVLGAHEVREAGPDRMVFGPVAYQGLRAFDATGSPLPARMALSGRTLSLIVDDAVAAYPVSIDPLATTANWVVESNQAGGNFGFKNLMPAGDVNADGYADLIVASNTYDNGEANEGRALLFLGGSGGLSTTASWVVEGNQASAQFGNMVAAAGDVDGDGFDDVLVGEPYRDNGQVDEGRAYVYHGAAAGLSTTASWVVEIGQTSANFALSVSPAGDVNGDGYSDVATASPVAGSNGKAYVYHGSAAGLSTTASWTYQPNEGFTWFGGNGAGGRPLSALGDLNADGYSDLAIGAYALGNGESAEGRIYVFHGSSTGLGASPAVKFEPNLASTQWGLALCGGDVNGDGFSDLVVGAPIWSNGEASEGRSLVYRGASTGLNTAVYWSAEPDQAGADYGWYVGSADLNGDGYSDVLVGADAYSNGETNEGRTFVYHGGSSGVSTTVAWTAESNQASAFFGTAVDGGDVNGDGFSDAMVSAFAYANGSGSEGRCFVYHFDPGTVAFNTYDLPGVKRMQELHPLGNTRIEHTNNRVVRDSRGFWYFVWQPFADNADTSKDVILLSFTTTSTPTASTDWGLVTLVDGGGTDVIGDGLTDENGWAPGLAMASNDELHFVFAGDGANPTPMSYFWTKCTNLSALTQSASWAAVEQIGLDDNVLGRDVEEIDIALDSNDVPHVLFVDDATDGSPIIRYTKYDTSTGDFLATKYLSLTNYEQPRIDIDLDNNVYALFHSVSSPWTAYLLVSTNAWSTSPSNSIWKDLAQSTTDPDTVATVAPFSAAQLCVDRNGVVHALAATPSMGLELLKGRIKAGFQSGGGSPVGPWKRNVGLTAFGNGYDGLYAVKGGGTKRDAVQAGIFFPSSVYRGDDGFWGFPASTSDLAEGRSQTFWTERKAPPNRSEGLWFVADSKRHRISTSWTDRYVPGALSGWQEPVTTKRQRHPHLVWTFPNTSTDLGAQPLPVVSQSLKSAVYTADPISGGQVFAVDRVTGLLARSYACTGANPSGPMAAAAYAGNVHLFQMVSGTDLFKLTDNGNSLVRDTAWANNPQSVSFGGSSSTGQFLFLSESGTRYLYALGDVNTTVDQYGLYKLKADNGVLVSGFPVQGSSGYVQSTTEHLLRSLNDQIFIPEDYSFGGRLYRRESDGSGEIVGAVTVNVIQRLIQVRNNNRLFVSPEDKVVYQLTSGLATAGWTAGQSANLGVAKTGGAYWVPASNLIYVGAGNQVYRLNGADGSILSNWPMATTGNVVTLPVRWKTFIYFGTSNGRLYAVNSTTNVARANWPVLLDTTLATPSVRSLAFDAVWGHVYFSTGEGRIYKLSTE